MAWGVGAVFAFLPAQVISDGLGLRHLMETTGVLALLWALDRATPLAPRAAGTLAAFAQAVLTLTRVSFLVSGSALIFLRALFVRSLRPVWAILPALVLVFFHFQKNHRKNGDPLRHNNHHPYLYANLQIVCHPGFHESEEERARDPYRTTLTYRQWAFQRHTPWTFVIETGKGYGKFFWTFFNAVYFRSHLPDILRMSLLILWMGALGWALAHAALRPVLGGLLILLYPYAFVGHVFWAGRFFVPYTPIALILMGCFVVGLGTLRVETVPLISRG